MTLHFLTAGESHGPAMLAILEGIPAGLPLSGALIDKDLARRQRGFGTGPRMQLEKDRVQIMGGVMDGETTGAPLGMVVKNRDHAQWRGKAVAPFTIPRPGHADLAGAVKYGYRDLRPALERASARETVARVAVGAVCRQLLAQFGIQVGGYVRSIGTVDADLESFSLEERIARARDSDLACPDPAATAMRTAIQEAVQNGDTLGGMIEVAVLGLPPGLGSFVSAERRLDARLAAAVFSVQAVKGLEIGDAFASTRLPGTRAHDAILQRDGGLLRASNHAGGLEGGMTNGQPLLLRAAMKPIATTLNPQSSVDLSGGAEVQTHYERSDFCPVPRAVVVLEAAVAFVLADALLEKLGGDALGDLLPRFAALRRTRLEDLPMDGTPHTWWPQ